MRRALRCLCWLVPAAALAADTPVQRSAADELEAELRAQISIPDPELVIITDGPDPERYGLAEALVEVDGAAVPGPVQPGWGKELYRSRIAPGNHVITAQFVYRASKTGPFPWNESYRYRVPGKVELQAQRGLRLTVHLRVETHEEAEDSRSRLAFRAALEPPTWTTRRCRRLPPPSSPRLNRKPRLPQSRLRLCYRASGLPRRRRRRRRPPRPRSTWPPPDSRKPSLSLERFRRSRLPGGPPGRTPASGSDG